MLNSSNPKVFWSEINKLGPEKSITNIDSIIKEDGDISYDQEVIRERWKEEYSKLSLKIYNRKLESEYKNLTTHDEISIPDDMKGNISLEEIESAMKHAKLRKAVGIDNLPNEVLRNTSLLSVLQTLFKLFSSMVTQVMDYSSGVWGYKIYDKLEPFKTGLLELFLVSEKVNRIQQFVVTPPYIRRRCNIIRLRIMSMNSNRLPHQIFVWDSAFFQNTWYNDLKQLMANCELNNLFNTSTTDGLSTKFLANFAENVMMDNFFKNWKRNVSNMPKLRTFKLLHSKRSPIVCQVSVVKTTTFCNC
ncbi:unnamed protein product [Mytilus edulis]|uniref:Uncharacterized protein n=1 Tax=Mytilus edulis TaxID=6550 RepID=A0A8S3S3B6_MYTED|nr:unnamed protein product [Mytilus edulis]